MSAEQVGSLNICRGAYGYVIHTSQPGERVSLSAQDLLAMLDWLLIEAQRLEQEAEAQEREKTYAARKQLALEKDALFLPPIPDG